MKARDRLDRLAALHHSSEQVEAEVTRIYRATIDQSIHIRSGNFEAIAVEDLRRLFDLYDDGFFGGLLGSMLREDGEPGVTFRLSGRLTSAAGKTFFRRTQHGPLADPPRFEIAISTTLLFGTFADVDRPIKVAGLICRDRLEALQRTFEHELLHLAEFLAEGRSSCKAGPFQMMSRRIFGHAAAVHELVTPREAVAASHAIRPGDLVAFEYDGVRHVGRVNRITRRASVLVEDPSGRPYSDGRRYLTFYVPPQLLRKEDGPPGARSARE